MSAELWRDVGTLAEILDEFMRRFTPGNEGAAAKMAEMRMELELIQKRAEERANSLFPDPRDLLK